MAYIYGMEAVMSAFSSKDIPGSEITPENIYFNRRSLLLGAGAALAASSAARAQEASYAPLPANRNAAFTVDEKLTSFEDVTTYNNFYEFGLGKSDPSVNAPDMKTRPWTVSVEGEVAKPGMFDIETLLKLAPMEERVYRLRCVEAWSMVIPWVGYPLAELMKKVEPTSNAKFVTFETAQDTASMTGLRRNVIDWPYTEGLRIDEAAHPLTLLTFGVYGKVLPNQNGAPLRVVMPWKYGFKSAKSLVRIRFTAEQPTSAWMKSAPNEYGFYANVNPDVPHPRWSQASERRIGEDGFFAPKRKTLPFNGYGDQVASLYSGMDLAKFY